MASPYREPDFRCEATRLCGERCILIIGHRGMHMVSGGDCWVMAGDAGDADTTNPGGVLRTTAGDAKREGDD